MVFEVYLLRGSQWSYEKADFFMRTVYFLNFALSHPLVDNYFQIIHYGPFKSL